MLRPAGFFQKAISEVSSKFFKEDFKFRLMICSTLDDLFAHVERSQVTLDLDGELMYSHHEWIQQRIVSVLPRHRFGIAETLQSNVNGYFISTLSIESIKE